ncbi:hypothetical protein [Protaetiibacter larvae]|uniref:Uncharacterized protein n=1 Tax=Protaetiibacter larvae TaxID=2592654 RepID=A0A5C1Y8W1_9MICO|nr:hypothetical protein [Protaetiibacter larvae]QEO10341.1 hypothetical protein FLP23_10185 [Protaetiibacter larvae]
MSWPPDPPGTPVDPFPPGAGWASERTPTAPVPAAAQYRPRVRRGHGVGRWVGGILVALLVVGLVAAAPWDAGRRQAYADQWVVWTQPPSAQISELAASLALTEDGRRVFFASRPRIEQANEFQAHCDIEATIVLGCYYRGRIYVYDVTDERLAGTIEVTAAHELLHAVHDRLSPEETARIDALVSDVVATLPDTDPNLAVVASYPEDQRLDEWHSRLGTEYAQLPAALEQHYAQVFSDRARIVAFENGSTSQLDGYADRIDQLGAELDAASAELQARSVAYDDKVAALNADIEAFNARADRGEFDSPEDFDRARTALEDRQSAVEAERVALNADVRSYNDKLAELQSLDAERAELYSHLDSHSAP